MTNGEKIKEIFPNIIKYGNILIDDTGALQKNILFDDTWWNAEYKEPITKNDLGVDTDKLISDCEKMSFDMEIFNKPLKVVALDAVKNIAKDLPSVTPQEPRKGHWIPLGYEDEWWGEVCTCSECGSSISRSNYCPNCGAFCGGDNNG